MSSELAGSVRGGLLSRVCESLRAVHGVPTGQQLSQVAKDKAMSFLESIDAGVPLSALELGDAGMSQSPAQAASAASILSPRFVSTHPLLVRPLAFMLDAALTSAVEACLKIDADAPPSLQGAWQDAIDPIWRFLVAFPLENPASLLTELWGLLDRASQVGGEW